MKRILGFACALAALFAVDHLLRNPYWFNDPRHFLGGLLAACLVGACLHQFAPEVFGVENVWLELFILASGATLLGVYVEFFEYYFARPGFLVLGGSAIEWEQDTVWDLQMDFLGAVVGAAGYSVITRLRSIIAR